MLVMNDLAQLGAALSRTYEIAEQNGYSAKALTAMVPMFGVGMVHTLRALMLLALDAELESARR